MRDMMCCYLGSLPSASKNITLIYQLFRFFPPNQPPHQQVTLSFNLANVCSSQELLGADGTQGIIQVLWLPSGSILPFLLYYLLHFAELSTRTISLPNTGASNHFCFHLIMFVWIVVQIAISKFLYTTLQLEYLLLFLYLGTILESDIAKFLIIWFGLHTSLLYSAHLQVELILV